MAAATFAGLDLLATAVVMLDDELVVRYANPAAENLLTAGARSLIGQPFLGFFAERIALERALEEARVIHWDYSARNVTYVRTGREPLPLSCTVTPIDAFGLGLLAEFRPIEQQLRIAREERLESEQQANRELIRNLAHEIKNPLGGIRGAAQLLERELDRPELHEYTQVIIKEADRLQSLMDRLLTPHRAPRVEPVNVHEVLERVRSLVRAEFGIDIERDYDPSLPELMGDREQLIQAVLNIARNAAQAGARSVIVFRTRARATSRSASSATGWHWNCKSSTTARACRRRSGTRSSIRWSRAAKAAAASGSRSRRRSSTAPGRHRVRARPGRTVFRILLPLR